MSEHDEQKMLYQWKDMMVASGYAPELDLLFAIPNEIRSRNKYATVRMKEEGLKRGVIDNFLPVARQGYIGFWIEMKYGRNYLSEDQRAWAVAMIEQGHRVDVHYTFEAAAISLCDYLGVAVKYIR
jgi:hypothetical protein